MKIEKVVIAGMHAVVAEFPCFMARLPPAGVILHVKGGEDKQIRSSPGRYHSARLTQAGGYPEVRLWEVEFQ